jgi:hypothetical protein
MPQSLAQELGLSQPILAASAQQCTAARANMHLFGQPNTFLAEGVFFMRGPPYYILRIPQRKERKL